jgi:hypothetical protein
MAMLNRLFLTLSLGIALSSHANLVSMSTAQLNETTGQGGADLSWTLSLNHVYATDMSKEDIYNRNNPLEVFYKLNPTACGDDKKFCRLAISPNNHVDAQGNKKWLVFKGIQGTIQIDKFSIDGTTIINHQNNAQSAMKVTFYDDKPLKIRNLGFETLAIETGTSGKEGYANTGTYTTYMDRTYKADGNPAEVEQNVPDFDLGAEKGFMGLNMHGNLHMSGNLKIFSYNCTGNGSGRC